jgi:alkylation response protein AidB-like acyl-CoA dehydrogenase
MHFDFDEDQKLFQSAVANMLAAECTHEAVAAAWEKDGRIPGLWKQLAEMGVVGATVPVEHGGSGMSELDWVLLFEEAGRAALPEPLAAITAVAAPLLGELGGELAAKWLGPIAGGDAFVCVGLAEAPFVDRADIADLFLLPQDGELHALEPGAVELEAQPSVDGARRLFRIRWEPSDRTRVARGERAAGLLGDAFDRAALSAAAELIGVGRNMIDMTVEYAKERQQFGKPIGSFQAIKHHLATALTRLEMARPMVHMAAYAFANRLDSRPLDVSTAKAMASDASYLCSRVALQCHGAIGYSYEYHLHLWMKRAWSLGRAYGDAAWHRRRAAEVLLGSE